ncbi:hypothetical protein FQN49_000569 [Arthroderma sp. PD_2]|nr:hypothetical protein FQN49_000569 [Arthroderma sp. PD_2]
MGHSVHHWIQDKFNDYEPDCADGTRWDVKTKISEKLFVINNPELTVGEAQVGHEAILKIQLQ